MSTWSLRLFPRRNRVRWQALTDEELYLTMKGFGRLVPVYLPLETASGSLCCHGSQTTKHGLEPLR